MAEEENQPPEPKKSKIFDGHTFKWHNIFHTDNWKVRWSFDTFRTPEGKDRLLCNGLRIIGIFGMIHLATHQYRLVLDIILTVIFLILCGVTRIRFFQNNERKFEFLTWA